jgi:stage III sporulation protein AF
MAGETTTGKGSSNTGQQEAVASTAPSLSSDSGSEPTESTPVQEPIQIGQIEVPEVQIEMNSGSNRESGRESNGNSGDSQNGQEADSTPVSGEQAETNPQQGQTTSRSERAVQIITLLTEKWDIDANKVQVKENKSASAL